MEVVWKAAALVRDVSRAWPYDVELWWVELAPINWRDTLIFGDVFFFSADVVNNGAMTPLKHMEK